MALAFFEEKQKFTQSQFKIWVIAGVLLVEALIAYYVCYKTETFLVPEFLLVILISFFSLGIFFFFELETKVDQEGIQYRFKPFHRRRRHILWTEVAEVTVKTYRPIMDYGGWGIRKGRKGSAYNVFGNQGLALVLKSGKRVLFGTQRPEELRRLIKQLRERAFIQS